MDKVCACGRATCPICFPKKKTPKNATARTLASPEPPKANATVTEPNASVTPRTAASHPNASVTYVKVEPTEHCAECGAELEPKPRYCSAKCRSAAWRKKEVPYEQD